MRCREAEVSPCQHCRSRSSEPQSNHSGRSPSPSTRTELHMCSDIFSPAIRTTVGWMALLMAAAAAGSGCGDMPTSATPATPESPPPSSRPRPASAAMISSAVAAGGAYVSMKPGTQANGQRAVIRNLRTGAVAAAPMTDGGFDPVGIPAQVGDTLSVTVVLRTGAQTIGYGV